MPPELDPSYLVYEDDVEKGEGAGNKQIFLKFSGKVQCHEIAYPYFVVHPTLAGTLINRLKTVFLFWLVQNLG